MNENEIEDLGLVSEETRGPMSCLALTSSVAASYRVCTSHEIIARCCRAAAGYGLREGIAPLREPSGGLIHVSAKGDE